ncbi:transposase family protein [Streptomyces sp900116325]|uniref:transposase family protein n=1 Tax=Streptomyces sp. 900116325 TaxID=3154295 RepID=UPI00339EC41F
MPSGNTTSHDSGLTTALGCSLRFKIHEGAVFVPLSSPIAAPACPVPRLQALREGTARHQVRNLVAEFEFLTDPRGASGVRYRLSSLLALVVCAMTPAGHDSVTAAAECGSRGTGRLRPALPPAPWTATGCRARRPCAACWGAWIRPSSARPGLPT